MAPHSEEGAPVRVVAEELLPETTENRRIEAVGMKRRRLETHLGVGQVEDEILPLVPNIVALETEEETEPVHQVHARREIDERRLRKVSDYFERRRRRSDLRVTQRRVLRQEIVDRDDVVHLLRRRGGRRWPWSRTHRWD